MKPNGKSDAKFFSSSLQTKIGGNKMLKVLKKEKKNVFLLSILFLILGFLILNTLQVPLLAETAMCGQGVCMCSCSGVYCECNAGPGDECTCICWLDPGFDFDYCNDEKGGPEPPG